MAGPLFQTMFTIVSICKEIDDEDVVLYVAQTKEGSEILAGRYKETGRLRDPQGGGYAVQVQGPVGASPGQYDGPEAQKVFENLERMWNRSLDRKV